jgi:hypothetical protein
MKVYYTKYALTSGIQAMEGEPWAHDPKYLNYGEGLNEHLLNPGTWFESWDDACSPQSPCGSKPLSLSRSGSGSSKHAWEKPSALGEAVSRPPKPGSRLMIRARLS